MTTYFMFDLETAANLTPAKIERFSQTAKTGNLKDPAKIEAKIREHVESCVEYAALSPATGRIVAYSWCLVSTENPYSIPPIHTNVGIEPLKEADLISSLSNAWKESNADLMLGFNIRKFDVPFLLGRSIARGVKLFSHLPRPNDYNLVADFRDYLTEGSLSVWLEECGIAPKNGDGSMVAQWVERGDVAAIRSYSCSEMASMCELFARLDSAVNLRRNGL